MATETKLKRIGHVGEYPVVQHDNGNVSIDMGMENELDTYANLDDLKDCLSHGFEFVPEVN